MPTASQANPARQTLPTMYDLPSEGIGDAGMPDEFHYHQATLLNQTFRPPAVSSEEFFSAVDMNLYYDDRHTSWYKRPDWFGVIGVSRLYEGHDMRWSYVIWQEQAPPTIVVELLSPGTEKEDLGQTLRPNLEANEPPPKWEVYEQILRVPYYAIFSRGYTELRIFQLTGQLTGARYTEVTNHGGRFWIPEAQLGLGLWQGHYHGMDRLWLRWFNAEGNWLLTPEERAEQAQAQAEQARQEKDESFLREAQLRERAAQAEHLGEQERQRAARLAELLRQLGHDPDQI